MDLPPRISRLLRRYNQYNEHPAAQRAARRTGNRRVKVPEALFGEIALKIAI